MIDCLGIKIVVITWLSFIFWQNTMGATLNMERRMLFQQISDIILSSAISKDDAVFSILIGDEVTESRANKKFCHFVLGLSHGMIKYHHNRLSRTFLARTTGLAISNTIKESLCTYV